MDRIIRMTREPQIPAEADERQMFRLRLGKTFGERKERSAVCTDQRNVKRQKDWEDIRLPAVRYLREAKAIEQKEDKERSGTGSYRIWDTLRRKERDSSVQCPRPEFLLVPTGRSLLPETGRTDLEGILIIRCRKEDRYTLRVSLCSAGLLNEKLRVPEKTAQCLIILRAERWHLQSEIQKQVLNILRSGRKRILICWISTIKISYKKQGNSCPWKKQAAASAERKCMAAACFLAQGTAKMKKLDGMSHNVIYLL